jgi:hypothetical protein
MQLDPKIGEMDEQQPQEWTPEYVERILDDAPAEAGSFFVAIADAHNAALAAEQERVKVLVEALEGLIDGLDANGDERCGLSDEQWRKRIKEARAALAK